MADISRLEVIEAATLDDINATRPLKVIWFTIWQVRRIENYKIKLSTASRRLALRQALSLAAKEDRIRVIEAFEAKEAKAKQTIALLKKMNLTGSVLIVVDQKDNFVDRATRNLTNVKAVGQAYLNVFDVMNADHVLVSRKALEAINQRLGVSK